MPRHQTHIRLLCGLILATATGAQSAARATPTAPPPPFVVNSPVDVTAGGVLTNGVCETAAGNGVCTLRAAIMKANHFPGGGVNIIVPALPAGGKYLLTLPATAIDDEEDGGDLNITAPMTITGSGAANTIIDASGITPTTRVLSIGLNASTVISGVTIQGGNADSALDGGGIRVNIASLTLNNSTVTGNAATFNGGGIYNEAGSVTLNHVTVIQNTASNGGGVSNFGGRLDLFDSSVLSNTAQNGAGIDNTNYVLNVVDSTIAGNIATNQGGGLFNFSDFATFINSTVGNNAAGADGGGIFNSNTANCCTLKLYNATIALNRAGLSSAGGGIDNALTSTVTLRNTILSNNTLASSAFIPSDCSGTFVSQGYNDISSTAGCVIAGTTTGNLLEQFALIRPLGDNAGPTPTFALLRNSPAVDAGDPGGCTDDLGALLTTDQRGAPRPAFGRHSFRCDTLAPLAGQVRVGAFELQQIVDLPFVRR